jgi:hypothetical protein
MTSERPRVRLESCPEREEDPRRICTVVADPGLGRRIQVRLRLLAEIA